MVRVRRPLDVALERVAQIAVVAKCVQPAQKSVIAIWCVGMRVGTGKINSL